MSNSSGLIYKQVFDAQKMINDSPPIWTHPYKKRIYQLSCPDGCIHSGNITFSRWKSFPLPQRVLSKQLSPDFEVREDVFGYEPISEPLTTEWYLNFAHHNLFVAYGGFLFAQDEMQVAEHPALGALREALLKSDINPLTVENGEPTPILIKGVERRCQIATDPNPDQLRPFGLYGNNFNHADASAIELATTPLNPPSITNLIAMEAPVNGWGAYTEDEIIYILKTAFTGFYAAKLESNFPENGATVIHTGFWGCGAYGGNRVLMALLQLLAAYLAEIEKLVFHTFDASGTRAFEEAKNIFENELLEGSTIEVIVTKIKGMKFEWGVSDGN